MRISLMFMAFILFVPLFALAQDGGSPMKLDLSSLNLDGAAGAGGAKFTPPEYLWASADLEARRWLEDSATLAGSVKKDSRLEVITRKDGFVRIRFEGTKFGWVAEASTQKEKPASAEGDLPGLQPPRMLGGSGK